MNARPITRRLTSVLGGAAIALGAVASCVIAPAAQAAPMPTSPAAGVVTTEVGEGCAVSDASLTWGVLERWRAYITGTIANGGWTLSDGVTYETPAFSWSAGSGEIDADGIGSIAFSGGVLFSGHEDLLQINLANPVFELVSPTEAYLLLDLTSTKPTGEPDVALPGVRAVKLDLTGAITADGKKLEISDAPGRLTAEGASAFGGFYSAGEAVDPLSLTAQAPGCVLSADGIDVSSEPTTSADEPQVQPVVVEEAPAIPWLPIGIGGLALVVIGVAAGLLLRGGKPKAKGGSTEENVSDSSSV